MTSRRRGKTVSEAEFRRLWLDRSLTIKSIAIDLDITAQAVRFRAKSRGLDPRRGYPREMVQAIRDPEFARMWNAGVRTCDLVALYQVSHMTVPKTARRLGLPPRGKSFAHRGITLDEYRQSQIAARMSVVAANERSAFRVANMVDVIHRRHA